MNLKDKLEKEGIESSILDDLVHKAASETASRINNQGLAEQLDYLESAGYSESDIIAALP